MITGSGSTQSLWMKTAAIAHRSVLKEDMRADVCIIGAGIAGLTVAYMLTREGKRVIVLDDGTVADGESARTTAHLSCAIDDRFFEIERVHGADGSRLAAGSHASAIDAIESICRRESIDCDFERLDGYLFCQGGQVADILDRELDAAHRAGLTDVQRLQRAPLGFDTGPCLRFPRQGQFHVLKYLAGLTQAIIRDGGMIFTQAHVSKIDVAKPARVTTDHGPAVTCDSLVVATNSPINDMAKIHTKQAAYRTYVIGAKVPAMSVPRGLYWDTAEPYHYVRLQRVAAADGGQGDDILIVGGEDHKTGQADDAEARFACLEAWMLERFPSAAPVGFRWSGQVMETADGLGFIGRNPGDENVFVATGDSGMGMTHGTIAGMLISDLVMGRPNAWEKLYDPSRKPMHSIGQYLKENLNVVAQLADYIRPSEVSDASQIPLGSGAVMREGVKRVAVYRDQDGQVHKCSASCTHLGCVVQWNSLEKSWDCPCHGSRFDAYGKVLAGPAYKALSPVAQEVHSQSGRK